MIPGVAREHTNTTAALEKLNLLLLELAKSTEIDSGDFDRAIRLVTEIAARALDVERASVWFYNADRNGIVCQDLYVRTARSHSSGVELKAADFPRYFDYLAEQRTLPAHDAMTDPCTSEFAEVYLRPLGIVSMLDAPIRIRGVTFGVLCSEHVGVTRIWSEEEQFIAGALSDVVARAQIASDRAAALKQVSEYNLELERIVQKKTEEVRALHADRMEQLGMMLRVLCHDLATPMAVARLSVEKVLMALDAFQKDPSALSRIAKDVQVIHRSMGKLERISERAKETLKKGVSPVTQEVKVDAPQANLGTILFESIESMGARLIEKGIQIKVQDPEGLRAAEVFADPLVLETDILNNVLTNAIKFSFPESEIVVSHEMGGKEVRLTIQDHGIGIPQELIRQFREQGNMPSRSGTSGEKGTGFGMELIRKHMKNLNGGLEIASRVEDGPIGPRGTSITLVFVRAG